MKGTNPALAAEPESWAIWIGPPILSVDTCPKINFLIESNISKVYSMVLSVPLANAVIGLWVI